MRGEEVGRVKKGKKIENPELVGFRSEVPGRVWGRTAEQIRPRNSAGKVSVGSISGALLQGER